MKRSELNRGTKALARRTPLHSVLPGTPDGVAVATGLLAAGERARRNGVGVPRRRAVSPASATQRAKVREATCLACAGLVQCGDRCQAAHLIDRSLTTVGQDDPLAVVPLCAECHRMYDEGGLDLLPSLERGWRAELAYAVSRVGLLSTYRRVTNTRGPA